MTIIRGYQPTTTPMRNNLLGDIGFPMMSLIWLFYIGTKTIYTAIHSLFLNDLASLFSFTP